MPNYLLGFNQADWGGRCVAERQEAWREAVFAFGREHGRTIECLRHVRAHRRTIEVLHIDCEFHAPLDYAVIGWTRQQDGYRAVLAWPDGSDTERLFASDDSTFLKIAELSSIRPSLRKAK